jgi:hypothetical protein
MTTDIPPLCPVHPHFLGGFLAQVGRFADSVLPKLE